MTVNYIKNAFGFAALIVIVYMLIWFYSGAALYGKIEGSWRGVDCANDYTFTAKEYIHGAESGSYRIRRNKIFLGSDKECFIRIKDDCLFLDGLIFLKIN